MTQKRTPQQQHPPNNEELGPGVCPEYPKPTRIFFLNSNDAAFYYSHEKLLQILITKIGNK